MYIAVAIVAFGLLIAIHELGHFTAAKALGVKVNEFAIGMGPKLISRQGRETQYSLRLLPFGGFCAMEGEDEETGDARAFTAQKRWKRVVILAAGAAANFLAGIIVVAILTFRMTGFVSTEIVQLADGFPNTGERGLLAGDTIVSINGSRLYYSEDFTTFMSLAKSGTVDLVVLRDGERVRLDKYQLERREYMTDGELKLRYGVSFKVLEGTFSEKLKYACYTTMNFVRLIWVSLAQLVSGAAGVRDMSGPVGIVSAMNDIGQTASSTIAALGNIAYFAAFVAINLAVMNMLPIPALDGGRILFVFLTWAVEKTTRRRLNPKYEGYVHAAALVLLMGLMVFTFVNDVVRLVNG